MTEVTTEVTTEVAAEVAEVTEVTEVPAVVEEEIKNVEEEAPQSQLLEGTVKSWMSKGFGFITRADGNDIFVHKSALPPKRQHLKIGEKVTFKIVEDSRAGKGKQCAEEVQGNGIGEDPDCVAEGRDGPRGSGYGPPAGYGHPFAGYGGYGQMGQYGGYGGYGYHPYMHPSYGMQQPGYGSGSAGYGRGRGGAWGGRGRGGGRERDYGSKEKGGESGLCYQFRDKGSCSFGDECRFSHQSS